MDFPDPVLTASIYCDQHLDAVLRGPIASLWRTCHDEAVTRTCYLWTVRYSQGGEHLKIRLHGPANRRPLLEELLVSAVEPFLAELPPPAGARRHGRRDLPPIDVEDRAVEDVPDRSLLWTEYRRSAVSLGGEPLVSDDGYAARVTVCLGRGCEMALAALAASVSSFELHRRVLFDALTSGLAAAGFTGAERADYLTYHRDWLIRSVRTAPGAVPEAAIYEHFERQAKKPSAARPALRRRARDPDRDGIMLAAWRRSVAELARYVRPLLAGRRGTVDPFARDPVFLPLFKVFHGLATQLGVEPLLEAFINHLLLRAHRAADPGGLRVA